jgi:hypothetical protein
MKKLTILFSVFIFALSIFCIRQTNGQNRKSVSAREVNGTFQAESGNEFKILALGKGKLRVAFAGISQYASAAGMTANVGEAEGEAKIKGDTVIFAPEEFERCKITIKFLAGNKIEVKQEGDSSDCGFGNRVFADGIYQKVSNAKPKF